MYDGAVASDLRGIDRNTLGDVTNSIAVNPLYVDRGGRASWGRPSRLFNRFAPWIGNEMSSDRSVGATPRICWPIPPTDGAAADAGLDSAFRRRGRTSRKECACSNGQCCPTRTRRRQPCLRWLSRRLLRHPRPFRTRRHCAPAPACRVGSWGRRALRHWMSTCRESQPAATRGDRQRGNRCEQTPSHVRRR